MKPKMQTKYVFVSAVFVLYFFLVSYLLRFNPDPHHDGILISSGLMVANGLTPHLDFRFIWGPLLPYLLSIPLELSPNLYTLRIFGYVNLCICAFQLYRLNRTIFPEQNARQISLIWLVSFPPLSLLSYNSWPMAATVWPNTYAFLLILIAINTLLMAIRSVPKLAYILFIFAGLLAFASVLIRINFITLFLAMAIYIYWLYGRRRQLIYFVLPGVVVLLGVYLFRYTNQVTSWYGDIFLSLSGDTESTGVPNFTVLGILRSILAIMLLAGLYFTALLIVYTSKSITRRYFIILLLAITFFSSLVIARIKYDLFDIVLINKATPWLQKSFSQIALGYIAAALVLLVPLSILNFRRNLLFNKSHPNNTLLGLLAFSSIPLNHNLNIDYIWINSLFFISYVLLSIYLNYKWEIRSILMPSFVFCGISLILGLTSLAQSEIYSFQYDPLKFMKHKVAIVGNDLDQEMSLFYKIPAKATVKNNCSDSIYLSTNNNLILSGKSLMYESNPYYLERFEKANSDWVFECNVGLSRLDELKDKTRYMISKNNGNFSVIYKPTT